MCVYCGSGEHVEIEHIDGHEENGEPDNLAWACRSCNTTKGAVFAREGIGRLTRQFNPRKGAGAGNLKEWTAAAAGVLGAGKMKPAAAMRTVKATPPATRAKFARALAAGRRQANPAAALARYLLSIAQATAGRAINPTFEQYLWAVSNHTRGAHDAGGAIIHETPKEQRQQYARRIASSKSKRRAAAAAEVPF